jgi:putative nucleotidyltransferase with HDIG domain
MESDDPRYHREFVHRILYADGRVGHMSVRFFIAKDSQSRTVKTYGVNQDITERLEAELRTQRALEGTIQAVAQTIETRDPYTAGHQKGVTKLAVAIAQKMQLADDQIRGIRVAATLHDMGKISVPAEILSKPGRLSTQEFLIIQEHPKVAYEILKGIAFPWPIADIILQHHERMDGSGYPQGLSSEDGILLEARILAVADVVEAMSTHRPYRPALGVDAALEEIRSKSGTQFDPAVVSACVDLFMKGEFALEV